MGKLFTIAPLAPTTPDNFPLATTKALRLSAPEPELVLNTFSPDAPNEVSIDPDGKYLTTFASAGVELVRPPTYKAPVESAVITGEDVANSPFVPNAESATPRALNLITPYVVTVFGEIPVCVDLPT